MAVDLVQLQISAAVESFRMEGENLTQLLTGPEGPLAHQLMQRAIAVEEAAKRNATGRPGPMVRTGRLRSSITWRMGHDENGLYADIGTAVYYAIFVEMGTSKAPAYPFLRPALEAARIPE